MAKWLDKLVASDTFISFGISYYVLLLCILNIYLASKLLLNSDYVKNVEK